MYKILLVLECHQNAVGQTGIYELHIVKLIVPMG